MLRDFRFAFRVLTARPIFTLVAALSIALGIGANSAIFGLVDALWFRPLAVPKSGEIVRIFSVTGQDREGRLSYPEYLDLKQQATSLRELVAIGGRGAILEDGNGRELHGLNLVSSNFFTALGVQPALGRLFTPQDEADSAAPPFVVLGNRFWERHYGRDPNESSEGTPICTPSSASCPGVFARTKPPATATFGSRASPGRVSATCRN